MLPIENPDELYRLSPRAKASIDELRSMFPGVGTATLVRVCDYIAKLGLGLARRADEFEDAGQLAGNLEICFSWMASLLEAEQ